MADSWNPAQYEKFKLQRKQPVVDLMAMIRPAEFKTAVDLGCGTGELTAEVSEKFKPGLFRGIDSSEAMLEKAKAFENGRLSFGREDIATWAPAKKVDLLFSNAALQWVPNHNALIPRLLGFVAEGGQIAIQVPCNFDHPSHTLATEAAAELGYTDVRTPYTLPVEKYARIFAENGFAEQQCLIKVYLHPLPKGEDVIEWTRGTLLTAYQAKLPPEDFAKFMTIYRNKLLKAIGEGPYLYTFKRTLLWGRRS